MEEPNNEDDLPIPIPAERMTAFLQAKKAKFSCPICETNDWTNMEDADHLGFLLPSQDRDGNQGGKVLPLMALICKNCNYVWMVARRPVESWLKEHPDGIDQ